MTLDLQAVRQQATTIVCEAAAVVMRHHDRPVEQTVKGSSPYDIVTVADQEAEAVIVAALRRHFPDHHIVGEEGGGTGAAADEAEYFWYIDPVDGTTNFANHIPMFCISIALTDRNLRPLVAAIYNPVSDELYSAAAGYGATLNGGRLHVSDKEDLAQCVIASGFPYDKHSDPDNNLNEWGAFLVRSRGVRRMGSAALDLCYVAAGRMDGYWEQKLGLWDCLGGILVVQEAGGTVTDYSGDSDSRRYAGGRIIASNGRIHAQMVDVLREARGVVQAAD